MSPRSRALATALTAALALAACSGTPEVVEPEQAGTGGSTTDGGVSPTTKTSTTTSSDGDDDSASGTDDDDATSGTAAATTSATGGATSPARPAEEVNRAGMAAVQRAEESVEGVAFQLDDVDDDGSWRVDVAVGPDEVEVTVSADGSEVLGSRPGGQLDDDDAAGLAAATIPLRQAIELALAEEGGALEDVELDREDGSFVWTVTVDRDGDDQDVHVDVARGEVVRVDR